MKISLNLLVLRFLVSGCGVLALTACDPFEQQRVEQAEKTRVECLDRRCLGDVEPSRDIKTQVVFKRSGRWFVMPREYGDPNFGEIAFFWPSKTALRDPDIVRKTPELIQNSPTVSGNYSKVAIQIYLTGKERWPHSNASEPWSQTLEQWLAIKRAEGKYIEQTTIHLGLDEYRSFVTQGGKLSAIYYAATQQRKLRGDGPPVLSCEPEPLHPNSWCAGGVFWQPDVYADFRFNAVHAKDWPEIYQEIIRVLNLLKETQP